MASQAASPREVWDPSLIPEILPRIARIAERLDEVSRETAGAAGREGTAGRSNAEDGAATAETSAALSLAKEMNLSSNNDTHTSERTEQRADGPSIALGQISDDDSSLHDFLFSSSTSALSSSSLSGAAMLLSKPTPATLALLKEARELQDIYRQSFKAVQEMEGAEWSLEEQTETIATLEQWRDREM